MNSGDSTKEIIIPTFNLNIILTIQILLFNTRLMILLLIEIKINSWQMILHFWSI